MKYTVYLQAEEEVIDSNHVSDRLTDLIIDEIKNFLNENPNVENALEFTIDIRNMKKSKFNLEDKDILIEKS
jgi:hypothetical protein